MKKKKSGEAQKKGGSGMFAFAAAAALAAATFVYLKKKGVGKKHAQVVKKHGQGLSALVKGEGRAAYQEVRAVVKEELAEEDVPPTRAVVQRIVKRSLAELKKHGRLTKSELDALSEELIVDWKGITADAKKPAAPGRKKA
ncbi:MAG: hypothetical protein WCV86_02530 [Patescibacteria group bacterium]